MNIATILQSQFSSFTSGAPSRAEVDPMVADAVDGIDPETATEEDLVSIRNALKEAGARPSISLAQSLKDAGFDPVAIRDAGRDSAGPMRMSGGALGGMMSARGAEMFDTLQTILQDYDVESLTEDDRADIAVRIRDELGGGPLLNRFA
jgi:hypothetical protein